MEKINYIKNGKDVENMKGVKFDVFVTKGGDVYNINVGMKAPHNTEFCFVDKSGSTIQVMSEGIEVIKKPAYTINKLKTLLPDKAFDRFSDMVKKLGSKAIDDVQKSNIDQGLKDALVSGIENYEPMSDVNMMVVAKLDKMHKKLTQILDDRDKNVKAYQVQNGTTQVPELKVKDLAIEEESSAMYSVRVNFMPEKFSSHIITYKKAEENTLNAIKDSDEYRVPPPDMSATDFEAKRADMVARKIRETYATVEYKGDILCLSKTPNLMFSTHATRIWVGDAPTVEERKRERPPTFEPEEDEPEAKEVKTE